MSLVTDSTSSQTALTPYAVNRRREAKDERQKGRDRRRKSSATQIQTLRRMSHPVENSSTLDPAEADDAVSKIETGLRSDPGTARESQTPNPQIVRAALRG